MSAPTWRIVLAVEGKSDARRLGWLLEDRIVRLGGEWTYESFGAEQHIKHRLIAERHRAEVTSGGFGRPPRGFGARLPGDRENIRMLAQLLTKRRLTSREDVIVLWARDVDEDPDRIEAARETTLWVGVPRVLRALATECGEAWVIAGWPRDTAGRAASQTVRKAMELPFDPVAHPERLSHKEDAPKSAKRCLAQLLEQAPEAEDACLRRAVRERGENTKACGLDDFCVQLDAMFSGGV